MVEAPLLKVSTAFAFAWVERVLRAKDQEFAVASAISTLNSTWLGLKDVGFETLVVSEPPNLQPSAHCDSLKTFTTFCGHWSNKSSHLKPMVEP